MFISSMSKKKWTPQIRHKRIENPQERERKKKYEKKRKRTRKENELKFDNRLEVLLSNWGVTKNT